MQLRFFLLPAMPSWVFGALYLAYSWYMSKRGGDNIGHNAHFFGAIFGFLFTIVLKPVLALEFIHKVTGH
jgi:membrane associated rhomboid family serine protease